MRTATNQFLSWLQGYISDLPTPFDENDNIDMTSFDRLCERQIAAGATALVVGEMAGEISTLNTAEHELLVRTAVNNSCGRVAIIAGVGSNSTHGIEGTIKKKRPRASSGKALLA